jgi:hypothetical protein
LQWESINRRNLNRATNDAYVAIGFLVGTSDSGRADFVVRPDVLREDVSTRPPTETGPRAAADAAILVIVFALVVLSDHGSSTRIR